MSRMLVTGCAGFVGSHLTEEILSRGDDVVGIDCFTDYYDVELKEANLAAARDDHRFTFLELDLAEDPLDEIVHSVSGIYHLAGQPGVRGSWGAEFAHYVRDNILATQRVFDAAAAAGVRVVFASSSSVYGNAEEHPTREDVRLNPISPYGVTKASCEQLARAYASSVGLESVGLRYFTVYGPRQRPDMAIGRVIRALLERKAFQMLGDGAQSRDVTYVGDAVAATIAAMEQAPAGSIYNVGGGQEATLVEVVAILEALVGRGLDVRRHPSATGDVRRTAADTSRIRADTDWRPVVSLIDGLEAHTSESIRTSTRVAARSSLERT